MRPKTHPQTTYGQVLALLRHNFALNLPFLGRPELQTAAADFQRTNPSVTQSYCLRYDSGAHCLRAVKGASCDDLNVQYLFLSNTGSQVWM